ncbi:aminoglycoside 6-adenylyltransferase [Pseudopedobacter beijingensis]|uniref:Aminoglycoside 6-adenylyltransferase n=1 Tax=Pseudopedobacter beijingensis TaxID=1207056 RepID=A0ABW4IA06_9SPHI
MRSTDEIKELIISTASSDDRIRAVLLNGSRANPTIQPDKYQDFDIVFVVNDLKTFTNNHNWTNCFGEKLISQLPNEMSFDSENPMEKGAFTYLMLFTDNNRIDLTLFPLEKFETDFKLDSLTVVWLDKDQLFLNIPKPTDKDYHIQKPSEKYFLDVCNEFWWVSTYVAKGLVRNEISYAKEMLETVVRPMFMKIIEWYIGIQTDFSISFGKGGKFMKNNLSKTQYDKVLATYSDYQLEKNWTSLFLMTELFGAFAIIVADKLKFNYDLKEEKNGKNYLETMYNEQKINSH